MEMTRPIVCRGKCPANVLVLVGLAKKVFSSCIQNINISGIQIEIKIPQTSYLVCLSCLWYVLSVSGRFRAILASFSSTVAQR